MGEIFVTQWWVIKGIESGVSSQVLYQEICEAVKRIERVNGGISDRGKKSWIELALMVNRRGKKTVAV